jgi:uncharacterized protein YkwD
MRRPGKAVVGVAAALVLAIVAGGVLSRSLLRSGAASSDATEARVLVLFNEVRAARGLQPLRSDAKLTEAAQSHSDNMLRHGYFAHDGPQGTWDVRISRYVRRSVIAEILASGTGKWAGASGMMDAWMHSPEHRNIILTPDLRLVGMGIATGTYRGQDGTAMATADFSSKVSASR